MRVLFADKLAPLAQERLTQAGFEVALRADLDGAALSEAMRAWKPDCLVVRSTRVDSEQVSADPTLALVIRAGAGVNTIDLDACSRSGVFVANCPGRNALAVAELAWGLIIGLDRSIPDNVIASREGRWDKKRFAAADGLAGRTLGLLGLGQIGQAVAARARAFDMPVVAWSRSLTDAGAEELGVARAASPVDVARRASVLSIHLALTPQTRGLVDDAVLGALPVGGLLVNTSRAEIIDEDALLRALDGRGLRAGLDVISNEPSGKQGPLDHPLARHPSVYVTHHVGASTQQAQDAVASTVCDIILGFLATGEVQNCVNLAHSTGADHTLVIRHRDRVGVLASVLQTLRHADHNIQWMENTIFAGGEAACARIEITGAPTPDVLEQLRVTEHVLHVSARAIGHANPSHQEEVS